MTASASILGACQLGEPRPERLPPPREHDTPDKGRVGDAITLEGEATEVEVTLRRVLDPVPGGPADRVLGSGARFVGLQLGIRNLGEGRYEESPLADAELIGSRGRGDPVTLIGGPCAGRFASHLMLRQGENAAGCIVFELAARSRPLELRFALDAGFAPELGTWKLG